MLLLRSCRSAGWLLASLAWVVSSGVHASPKDDISKPLKTVVQSVRFGKDALALKYFAGEEQGKRLLADQWDKATEAQRKEFVQLFHTLFSKLAFPKIRKNFENLDTVLYDEPKVEGSAAHMGSTILINHPLKKQELKVKYTLSKAATGWQVVDVAVLGDSMLKGIREDQIIPLLKEGGMEHLLSLMRKRDKEISGT